MIDAATKSALQNALGDRVEFDVAMARHTSLRIGGPADAMATPATRDELAAALAICATKEIPTRVLGAGFNVLVNDGGLEGVVLRLKKLRAIERVSDDTLSIEAGASGTRVYSTVLLMATVPTPYGCERMRICAHIERGTVLGRGWPSWSHAPGASCPSSERTTVPVWASAA